jgi:hypothetical protein
MGTKKSETFAKKEPSNHELDAIVDKKMEIHRKEEFAVKGLCAYDIVKLRFNIL